ncbi:ATP-binding protein [Stenotrophomonas pigmentata]|uniref:ATP-binding protein n=1 Tax=Stenotrophomonas pigmentata TaxID=3055080 RepID=UPI0026EF5D35|nr:ATP-binding protein [Stenotrophomonas sp. 610A2]
MNFLVLRLLTKSELGMFHEYRRQGKERAKQRAINFDRGVVDRIFPSANDSAIIAISCRRLEDERAVVDVASRLKRQGKNWRLEGDCPTSSYYGFVHPGALFAMSIDASTTPAKASWVVIAADHPAHAKILGHGESARLGRSAMISLYGDEGAHSRSVLVTSFPQLFDGDLEMSKTSELTQINGVQEEEVAPDPLGLFNILARAGHGLPSAVADLVDNSLSHGAREIIITFPNPNMDGRWMCVRDDGVGMTPSGLRDAMKIGHQRNYDDGDLGKFGYGLKGAAWSQADSLTVVSKVAKGELATLTWDKDHLASTRRWALLNEAVSPVHASSVQIGESGTAVLLTKMRPTLVPTKGGASSPYAQELASIKSHLELVFHRFLEGKVPGREKVVIKLNDEVLRANNPMGHPLSTEYDQHRIVLDSDEQGRVPALYVRAYVTPNESEFDGYVKDLEPTQQRVERERHTLNGRANDAQGLYFYRLHRLIKWGGWEDIFAKDEHTKLIRVAIDFDRMADELLQVDISKQLIRLPFAIRKPLEDVIKAPRAAARVRYNKKEKSVPSSSPVDAQGSTADRRSSVGIGVQPAQPAANGGRGVTSSAANNVKTSVRVVNSGARAWQRKTGFNGEEVEVTQLMPELVELVRHIDRNSEAKTALSEFLRVLESVGVPELLISRD